MSNRWEERAKQLSKGTSDYKGLDRWEERARQLSDGVFNSQNLGAQKKTETSLLEDVMHGLQRSSVGTLFGEAPESADTFGGRLAEGAGEIAGDIPAMAGGGTLGGLGGAALGSLAGPIGAAIGAILGSGAGAFAAPELVKSTAKELRHGTSVADALKNIAYDTSKSGLIGAATGVGGKVAQPLLGKFGGKAAEKILSRGVGRAATDIAGELGGMAAGQKFTGEDLSLEGLAQNALLLGGMRGAGKIAEKLPIKKAAKTLNIDKLLETHPKTKEAFDHVRDYFGERDAKVVESAFKWREALEKYEKNNKFTPRELEEMMYYRQKTGNPTIEGDTFKALKERLPENAHKFVDQFVDKHLKDSLKAWNDNESTHNIKPRQGLEEIYLPGLFDASELEIKKATSKLEQRFSKANPFSNTKTFMSYLDAYEQAGLKPRYKNIVDLMKAYDKVMIKATANNEFVSKIKDLEKESGNKIIVNAASPKEYAKAEQAGFVPFDDPFLRRFVKGTDPETGKMMFDKTERPALVDPQYAKALQGVFNKDSYKAPSKVAQYYDALANKLRYYHTNYSPFHYVALTEHAVPALRSMNIPEWMKQGSKLRKSKEFMADAARSGLTVGHGDTHGTYLFNEFQPNLKVITWDSWNQKMIDKLVKEGKPPSETQLKSIKRDMATFVNDLYGGQNWKTMQFFNDPKNLKMVRRLVGFPDWSVSAIRNAQAIFGGGPRGSAARQTWLNYGLFYFGTRALMDAFYKGWEQTDKDKSVKGIRFSPTKMLESFSAVGKGPEQWYQFALPDIPVKIGGYEFNPGRDAKGHKTYGHLGKSALEIEHYFSKTIGELFNKSNPVFQAIYKQVAGSTPGESSPFLIQGTYREGKQVPWGGTEPGTFDRWIARSKQLATELLPFSARGILPESITGEKQEGVGRYLGSALGAHPVSKGFTPYKATPYLRKAIKKGDEDTVRYYHKLLRENGYADKEIRRKITTIRNDLKKKKR